MLEIGILNRMSKINIEKPPTHIDSITNIPAHICDEINMKKFLQMFHIDNNLEGQSSIDDIISTIFADF